MTKGDEAWQVHTVFSHCGGHPDTYLAEMCSFQHRFRLTNTLLTTRLPLFADQVLPGALCCPPRTGHHMG